MVGIVRKRQYQGSMSAGPATCQGATWLGLCRAPQPPGTSRFCLHVFKLIHIKLSKSPVLGDVDRLAPGNLRLGPAERLNHMLLILQLGMDGHRSLTNVDPGLCPGAFQKALHIPVWSLNWGGPIGTWSHWGRMRVSTGKGCLLGATHTGHKLNTLQRR